MSNARRRATTPRLAVAAGTAGTAAAAAAASAVLPRPAYRRTWSPVARCLSAGAAAGIATSVIVGSTVQRARHDAEDAAERTREEWRQLLHGTVLQTVEALCAPDSHTRFDLLRLQAARDARKLRAYLNGSCTAASTLDPILEELIAEAAGRGLAVDVVPEDARETSYVLDPRALDALQLAASEALANAAKHSGAASATLRHQITNDGLALSITDAGIGFDPLSAAHRKGFGLPHVIARTQNVGGSATVDTAPGGGTVVHIWVPLSPASYHDRD